MKISRLVVAGALVCAGANAFGLTVSVAPSGNIQSAIDSVAAAGGGTVNITGGTGTISTALVMQSNVTLNGAGNPNTTLYLSGSVGNGITVTTGSWSNIAVKNLKVNGAGKTVAQNCIDLVGSGSPTGGVMSNVQTLNAGYDGGKLFCSNGSVTSCNFHDCGLNAYYHGMYFLGGSGTVYSGNQFNNSPYGSGLHLNNYAVISGGSSLNNTSSNNGQEGHSFTASTGNSWTNYTIDSCTANNNGYAYTSGTYYGFCMFAGSGTIKNCVATGNNGTGYYYGGFANGGNNR